MNYFDMKKLATLTVLALFAFAGTAQAQDETDNDQISASVNVVESISVTGNTDVSFGTIATGSGRVVLDPTTGQTDGGGGNPQAGSFTVTGTAGQDFLVEYDNEVTLRGDEGTITFNTDVHGNSTNDQAESTQVFTGNTFFLADGDYFFFVGGSVNVDGSATGEYTGNFTLTATYTGI